MTTYRTRKACIIRQLPSAFATDVGRLKKGQQFLGSAYVDPAWVRRAAGGYVARSRLSIVAGVSPMMEMEQRPYQSQDMYLAAVDRYTEAMAALMALAVHVPKAVRDELSASVGGIIEAMATAASQQSTSMVQLLYTRVDELEAQLAATVDQVEQLRAEQAGSP